MMYNLAWAVVLTLLAAHAQEGVAQSDCTQRFGPGCLQCANVTIANTHYWGQAGGNQYGDQRNPRQDRGGWGWRGRGLKHDGGQWGQQWGPAGPDPTQNMTRLVCTQCDTGYTLSTRGNNTYGSCKCAAGWGVVQTNATNTTTAGQWWEEPHRGAHGLQCTSCALEGKVPLTDTSNLQLSWDGSSWSLVLGSGSSAGVPGDADGDSHWHRGWGAWGVLPPYRTGQCVPCPAGSTPSADSGSCVADGSVVPSPSPSPSPEPAASPSPAPEAPPSPSPAPTTYGACLVVTSDDVTALAASINDTCSADAAATVSLDVGTWSEDPAMTTLSCSASLDIMAATGDTSIDTTQADCAKMAAVPGQAVVVTWAVSDAGISCSPSTGTFTLNVPNWGTTGSAASSVARVEDFLALVSVTDSLPSATVAQGPVLSTAPKPAVRARRAHRASRVTVTQPSG